MLRIRRTRVASGTIKHVTFAKWDATSSTNLRLYELAHLYHASMAQEDYDMILQVRDGDVRRDWNQEKIGPSRAEWDSEYSRFQYYDGKNPDWPEKALQVQYVETRYAVLVDIACLAPGALVAARTESVFAVLGGTCSS